MNTTWADVLLSLTRFCLAFLIPFVIFTTLIIVTKIKPTPVLVNAGIALTVFIGILILLPMDPRSRQYSWIGIAAIALVIAMVAFVYGVGMYYLQSRFHLPIVDRFVLKSGRQSRDSQHNIDKDSNRDDLKKNAEGDYRGPST